MTPSFSSSFDLIVIGAGINGAGIARDAAMRGLRLLLLDKGDISSGTSAYSTRLIHGGLRYLEYGELGLVRESLHERETLMRIAPHLVRPIRLLIPVYRNSRRGMSTVKAGMVAYDLLSVGKSVPRHRVLSPKDLLDTAPGLKADGLTGGVSYYDCQAEFAERLVVENAISAAQHGAVVRTYCRVERLLIDDGRVLGVECVDSLNGARFSFHSRLVINAAGPWVDRVLQGGPVSAKRLICGTKGSHIVVNGIPGAPNGALYVEAQSDGRPFFIIPWNGLQLIGTTDQFFSGDPDNAEATSDEVDYLLGETNRVLPKTNLTKSDVLYTYAGVRPLPCVENEKESAITRRHIILDHFKPTPGAAQIEGLISIVGGKLTTYRSLSERTVDLALKKIGRYSQPCITARQPLPGAAGFNFAELAKDLGTNAPLSEKTVDHLLRVYGGRAVDVVRLACESRELSKVIDSYSGAIAAEVVFAVETEMARTVADVLKRRTMIGFSPSQNREAEEVVLNIVEKYASRDVPAKA